MAGTPHPAPSPRDDLAAYVGRVASDAESRARARGWATVRSLPPGAVITLEYQAGRINFTVQRDGRVSRCWAG